MYVFNLSFLIFITGKEKDYCYVDPANAINILNLTKSTTETPPPGIYNRTNTNENRTGNSISRAQDHAYNLTVESLLWDSFSSSENNQDDSYLSRLIRRRRNADYVVPADTMTGPDGKKRKVVTMVS